MFERIALNRRHEIAARMKAASECRAARRAGPRNRREGALCRHLEGFVIVSSDSDFTRLATRLRESGMTVYGLGRRNTPAPFVAACDRFIYLDLLGQQPMEPAQRASQDEGPTPLLPDLKRILSAAITSTSKDDGWSNLGEVGSYLSKSHAAFDPRDYGHSKLGELVRRESYVEVKDVPGPTGCRRRVKTDPPLPVEF